MGTKAFRSRVGAACAVVAIGVAAFVPASPAAAVVVTVTGRASVGNGQSGGYGFTALSTNGRLVAFTSGAALVPQDTGLGDDVYVRDRVAGTVERVSLTDAEGEVGGDSRLCAMSDDGRFVAFVAQAANLAGGVYPPELYVRDRKLGVTEMVSVSSAEVPGNGETEPACAISDAGRFVVFESYSTNLGGSPSGSQQQVFRRDRLNGTTEIVSVSSAEATGNDASFGASTSGAGQFVAFYSVATNLVASDGNDAPDVFVRDMTAGTTERVSLTSGGFELAGFTGIPVISNDGRYVAFVSNAPYVGGDTNAKYDVFVYDRDSNQIERVSLTSADGQISGKQDRLAMSDDARWVAFTSDGSAVVPGHVATTASVFLRDRSLGTTIRISQSTAGSNAAPGQSIDPSVADDGSAVSFSSTATNVVPGDTNGTTDVFVRDLKVDLKPFASWQALVKQQYVDFEGRQPTSGELNLWLYTLQMGASTPDQHIDSMAHGSTWSARRSPVTRLYWSFFKRVPDVAGMDYWVGRLAAGKSLQWVAAQFAKSSEFQATYGSLTNSQFVTLVYQNIFDRAPDPGGLAYWTGQLNAGTKTRGDVMANFSESTEGRKVLAPVVDVVLAHLGMLRVMPSQALLVLWSDNITEGTMVVEDAIRTLRYGSAYDARIP